MHKQSCNDAQAKGPRIEPHVDWTFARAVEDVHLYNLEVVLICSLLFLLSNSVYFAYCVKCILDGQAQASGLELLVGWTIIFFELGTACKCSCSDK